MHSKLTSHTRLKEILMPVKMVFFWCKLLVLNQRYAIQSHQSPVTDFIRARREIKCIVMNISMAVFCKAWFSLRRKRKHKQAEPLM